MEINICQEKINRHARVKRVYNSERNVLFSAPNNLLSMYSTVYYSNDALRDHRNAMYRSLVNSKFDEWLFQS